MSMLFVAYNQRYFLPVSIGTGHVVEVILSYHNQPKKAAKMERK
jgi:hypothetical protein